MKESREIVPLGEDTDTTLTGEKRRKKKETEKMCFPGCVNV